MPRIRKKTSNRVKTRDREKRTKKVRDGRKKKAKASKKNPQWKSKKPKDPGIPNDFPYKDQILAEVQEQRRIAAEEKLKLKAEKAKAKAIARGELVDDDEVEDAQNGLSHGEARIEVDAEGIANLSAKPINARLRHPEVSLALTETDEDEDEAPALFNHDLPNFLAVLEKADVMVEVLDARDPLAYRNKHIEGLVTEKGKKILFVLNKIDRCPREAVAAWSERLRTEHPTLLFRSASSFLPEEQALQNFPSTRKGKGKAPVDDALGAESMLSCLSELSKAKRAEKLAVAVVGLTNVGKSSLINSLLKKATLPVYTVFSSSRGPTTTELPQEVSLDVNGATITFIDSPGLSFVPEEHVDPLKHQNRARDILLRCKGRIDRLKDPVLPIRHIVSRANNEDLMLLYSLPAFPQGDSAAFLSGVARVKQLVKRKGDLDLVGAARIVLRDWSSGKFAHHTTPPTTITAPQSSSNLDSILTSIFAPLYAKDEAILALLSTRKEIRKKGGLVKLSPSEIEERQATMESHWAPLEGDEDESDANDDELENVDGADVGFSEEEEEEESEGEGEESASEKEDEDENRGQERESSPDSDAEEEVAPPSHKQKRKRGPSPARPEKRRSLGPVSSSNRKKDRRHSQQANLKNKLASAVPKSILKAVVVKGGLSEKVGDKIAKQNATKAHSKKEREGDEPEIYDFGKFF